MARKSQRTRLAFTVSMVVHGAAAVALTLYILVEKAIIPNPFDNTVLLAPPPPRPAPRPRITKRVPQVLVLSETPVVMHRQATARTTVSSLPKTSSGRATSVLQAAPQAVAVNRPLATPRVRVSRPNTDAPVVVTNADLPIADGADALAYSAPVAGPGMGGGPTVGRSAAGAAGAYPRRRCADRRASRSCNTWGRRSTA
jgi:hypothetical protein